MTWDSFHCENPDFFVRSVPDGMILPVRRAALQLSEVFRDMFLSCTPDIVKDETGQVLDLHETASALACLMQLLHEPPPAPVQLSPVTQSTNVNSFSYPVPYDPSTIIPLPILISSLYGLVDKYMLTRSISDLLDIHLRANAPEHALQVYGFATLHGINAVASEASQYLMPMGSYRLDEVRAIPSVEAYHKVVRLQNVRVQALRKLVLREEIFPHDYGKCPPHYDQAKAIWDSQRKTLAGAIDTDTDVTGEMASLKTKFHSCSLCLKACTAAVDMLAYKCKKIPRRIDQLDEQ